MISHEKLVISFEIVIVSHENVINSNKNSIISRKRFQIVSDREVSRRECKEMFHTFVSH